MVETEPVTVKVEADVDDLKTGLNSGKEALEDFGATAERTGTRTFTLVGHSTNLLRTMLYLRAATAGTEHLLKKMGVSTEQSAKAMDTLNTIMEVGIVILAVYRAALAVKALAHWLAARAAAAHAAAETGVAIPVVGLAIGAAAAIGMLAALSAWQPPRAQFGGYIPPRPGGTLVRVGEAGRGELIVPAGGGRPSPINITMNITTNDPDYIVRVLGRRIQQLKAAGF